MTTENCIIYISTAEKIRIIYNGRTAGKIYTEGILYHGRNNRKNRYNIQNDRATEKVIHIAQMTAEK